MNWFLIGLIPPALWSITNYVDKYLIGKYFKNSTAGSLVIFTGIVGIIPAIIVLITGHNPFAIDLSSIIILTLCGIIYISSFIPYYQAMTLEDTSIVVPLWQMIPVISFIFGYFFLGEQLSINQIVGGMMIIISAALINLDFKKVKFNKRVFLLMTLSSVMYAVAGVIIKSKINQNIDFWTVVFWQYLGYSLTSILTFILIKKYRQQFISIIRENNIKVLLINGFSECLNFSANLILTYAITLIPLALAWTLNGFQPVFVFIYGLVLTLVFPKIIKEDLSTQNIIKKIIFITIIVIGSFIINSNGNG